MAPDSSPIVSLLVTGLSTGAVYGLMAIGLTLIFGVMRVINFAHGTVIVFAMYVVIALYERGIDPYLSILIVAPAFFAFGVVLYKVALAPLVNRGSSHTSQAVATLGVALIMVNLILVWEGAQSQVIRTAYSTSTIGAGDVLVSVPRLIGFVASLLIAFGCYVLLRRTWVGLGIRATAQDQQAAELSGVSTRRANLIVFGLGTALAGIAAALTMPFFAVSPNIDITLALTAYVVVVLGGLGSIGGAVVGGLLIGVIESFTAFYADPQLKEVAYLLVFVGVLIVRPSGLLGTRGYEALRDE
ncbi:MAG: branched-chain amino acid ABC transporter permease [Solirubrobacteraceae bacterium]